MRPLPFVPALLALAAGCAGPARVVAPATPVASATATAAAPAAPALPAGVEAALAAAKAAAAPDRRTARFDVTLAAGPGGLTLEGETDQPAALDALVARLRADGHAVTSAVRTLPDAASLGDDRWGVVTLSVANLRTNPGHSAELTTQALLGTPLRLLKKQRGWTLVQTPDRYIAWLDAGGFEPLPESAVRALAAAPKVIVTAPAAFARAAPSPDAAPVSDLVAGGVLEARGEVQGPEAGAFVPVAFPDGRLAYVAAADVRPYDAWLAALRPTDASLVETARAMLGAPYLWGGTSGKGMDCSGFTKMVYFLNGTVLPRDANQQAQAGAPVDDAGDWSRLRPGDLLFFGRAATDSTAESVVHVGMWIGGGEFIHAAGRVRINSMDPAAPNHDADERARYLRARRYLDAPVGTAALRDGGLYGLLAERAGS